MKTAVIVGDGVAHEIAELVATKFKIREETDRAIETSGFDEWLMAYHGKELIRPQRPSFYPEPHFVSWHIKEVFQGYGRYDSYL